MFRGLVKDLVTIATAPIFIAVPVITAVVKPVAEVAQAVVGEVKGLTK